MTREEYKREVLMLLARALEGNLDLLPHVRHAMTTGDLRPLHGASDGMERGAFAAMYHCLGVICGMKAERGLKAMETNHAS